MKWSEQKGARRRSSTSRKDVEPHISRGGALVRCLLVLHTILRRGRGGRGRSHIPESPPDAEEVPAHGVFDVSRAGHVEGCTN